MGTVTAKPLIQPSLPLPLWEQCETSSLQALVDILRKPDETCPQCSGSGKGGLKGYCEHCLGRGSLISP